MSVKIISLLRFDIGNIKCIYSVGHSHMSLCVCGLDKKPTGIKTATAHVLIAESRRVICLKSCNGYSCGCTILKVTLRKLRSLIMQFTYRRDAVTQCGCVRQADDLLVCFGAKPKQRATTGVKKEREVREKRGGQLKKGTQRGH